MISRHAVQARDARNIRLATLGSARVARYRLDTRRYRALAPSRSRRGAGLPRRDLAAVVRLPLGHDMAAPRRVVALRGGKSRAVGRKARPLRGRCGRLTSIFRAIHGPFGAGKFFRDLPLKGKGQSRAADLASLGGCA